jgi:hypothetical protein
VLAIVVAGTLVVSGEAGPSDRADSGSGSGSGTVRGTGKKGVGA